VETHDETVCPDEANFHHLNNGRSLRYIDLAALGKNGWPRYLLGTLFILCAWVAAGLLAELLLLILSKEGSGKIIDPLQSYLVLNLGDVGLVCGLFLVIRGIHKRQFLTLITSGPRIDWKRVAKGFGLWFVLCGAAGIVDYVLHPSTYRYVLNPGKFLMFAPVVLVLTPIQACAEELLFRGYLIQGAARWTKGTGPLAVLSGFLFMVPHLGNPEVASGFYLTAAYYFGVGFFLALVTMKTNSLEYAMGIHTAACLFSALIANYAHSVLETESIFFCTELAPDFNLAGFIIMALVSYWVLVWRPRMLDGASGVA
jgi:uncharacterized protein